MKENKDPELKKQEQEQIVELGSDITKSSKGNIYTLTIIGQVEGHQVAPETVKTTKYEHVLPMLAAIEDSNKISFLADMGLAICTFLSFGKHKRDNPFTVYKLLPIVTYCNLLVNTYIFTNSFGIFACSSPISSIVISRASTTLEAPIS